MAGIGAATAPAILPGFGAVGPLFTIHNLGYQGSFGLGDLALTGLEGRLLAWQQLEFYGRLNFMKAGLSSADMLSTVSPTYAQQIQGPDEGMGLDGLLRTRTGDLVGILNGIDEAEWDPATDPRLPVRYDSGHLDAKAANKAALQAELGLEPRSDVPLFVIVSRLTEQKGLDLVLAQMTEHIGRALGADRDEQQGGLLAARDLHRLVVELDRHAKSSDIQARTC